MNYVKLFYLVVLFPLLIFSQSENKQISFRDWTVDDGLSQNSVLSIAQDSIGFIWYNTQDGLNKYDGREFTYYDVLSSDAKREVKYITGELFVDKSGTLWVVGNSGKLNHYQQETDSFLEVSKFDQVITVAQDTDQNFYIGTYGKGLFKIDSQTKDTLQILKPKDRHFAVCSFVETDNKTILATTDDGIIEIKDGEYEFIELATETIFSRFAKSKNGTVYLGSYEKGLYIKNKNDTGFKPFTGFENNLLPGNLIIKDLLVDRRDWLWVTTERHGVFLVDFNLKTVQNFTYNKNDPYALGSNSLFFLYEDNAGTIWIGTEGAGVNYYDAYLTKFNVLTDDQVPQNVHIDVIRAITTDANNAIWVGTEGKGLTKINPDNQDFFTYTTSNSDLLGNTIVSLFYDEGNMWIGHLNHGLQIMDTNGKITSFKETVPFTVLKIFKDISGNMWLCTNQGLIQFDINKGIVKQFTTENSNLASNYYISTTEQDINTIVQGDANTLWIGTEFDGLYRLDIKENKFSAVDGISDRIFSLHYENSRLWIGTNGKGLKSYNIKEGTVATYTKKEGLPNDIIYGILPDSDGNLWLSSNKGITKLKIENDSVSDIKNYSHYFGLQSYEYNAGAYHEDANGILYFGGIKGLNWFNPKQLKTNPVRPKTALTKLELYNKEIPFSKELELSHDQNTVSFTFSSLQFSQPELNQYKYRLLNNDDNWIASGYNNVAQYTNLPPNDYEFQVISSNYDGVWNPIPATYSFTILKPWYATNLAKIIYGLLVVLFAFILYRYSKWRWRVKNQLRLEHDEIERLKKLDEFKTKLYTNISHEFRTPLTLISGPIDHQLSKQNLALEDRIELDLVKQNANRLLNLVNQMLDLSMVDSGQLRLKVSKGNLNILLKQIVAAFQYKADEKKIHIANYIENLEDVWYDTDIVEKIASNLLSNAIKYAPAESEIIIDANKQNEALVLSIINVNNTITQKDFGKLFQRFYQDDSASEGVGVGLALVKELVSLSKGSIIATNIDTDKLQFTVTLPIKKNSFHHSEVKSVVPIPEENDFRISRINNEADIPILLIVEDDDDIRSFITSIFKASYEIILANNGEEGIKKALDHIPDLIISDIMMPVKDGIALCNELKYNELSSHIPIILLTAKVGEKSEMNGLRTGADAYITKPFSSDKLKLRVEKLIENRRQLRKHFSKDFSINPELAITSTEAEFLNRLKAVMDKHIIDSEFSTEQFAKSMLMSRTQLHRKLKAIVGMSSSEFIRSQRLKISLPLLKKSDATVAEIAYQIGFNTPSYFIKCFKEIYGSTPNEYVSQGKS